MKKMYSRFSPGKYGCIVISRFPLSARGGWGAGGRDFIWGLLEGKGGGSDSHLYIILRD